MAAPQLAGSEPRILTHASVLVVDDEVLIRSLMTDLLTDAGYQVRSAGHGGAALKLLANWRPDLILLDLIMPAIDGWSFRAQQASHPTAASIPIIVMSSLADADDHALRLGAVATLSKPFDIELAVATVRRALAPRA